MYAIELYNVVRKKLYSYPSS